MKCHLSGCPGSWGIEDANNPDNTPWQVVLDELSAIGFRALELGPYGYLPLDAAVLTEELNKRHLKIVAGTLYDDLVSNQSFDKIVKKTHDICHILSSVPVASPIENQKQPGPFYVIIDAVKPEREKFPRSTKAPMLSSDLWKQMVAHIKEIARISFDAYGVRSVIHHHAGGYMDYSEEIDRILQDISEENVGLCFDTGHAFYAGIDPEEGIRRYGSRIDYVHFKDVNQSVYDAVKHENIGFYEACFQGLMCPLGEGALDYSSIKKALQDIEYRGWITIEQDKDPHDTENVPASLKQSISHLKKLGF